MDYAEALHYLDQHTNLEGLRGRRFSKPLPDAGQTEGLSLDSMRELLGALGDPQKAFRSIHITGTNGKGSTARYISGVLQSTGLSIGTYTSPNIQTINERLQWDATPITDEDFGRIIGLLAGVEPLIATAPSWFELLTAAAFVWFAELGVEVGVIEVGMLGRYDATNVIDADVAVVTNVGKDHTSGGEGWRHAVASEKAGIIKPGSHLILGFEPGPLAPVFAAEEPRDTWVAGVDYSVESNQMAVGGRMLDIKTPHQTYEQVFLPFHGYHQGQNLATALAAVEAFFGRGLEHELVEQAVAEVALPGRFEVVARHPTVILDGAHNPDGARAAISTLNDEFARLGSWILVIGLMGNKDPAEMLQAFNAHDFDAVICCEPDWSRRVPAEKIAEAAQAMAIAAEVVKRPVDAVNRALSVTADEDLIFVGGSIYVVGEVRGEYFPVTLR